MTYEFPTIHQSDAPPYSVIRGQKCYNCCKDSNTECSSCSAYEVDE